MVMTTGEFQEFVEIARANKVQEFSVGDVHVLLSGAALRDPDQPPDQPVSPPDIEPRPEALASAPAVPDDDDAVKKLMDDPDLFLSSDGPPPVPQ